MLVLVTILVYYFTTFQMLQLQEMVCWTDKEVSGGPDFMAKRWLMEGLDCSRPCIVNAFAFLTSRSQIPRFGQRIFGVATTLRLLISKCQLLVLPLIQMLWIQIHQGKSLVSLEFDFAFPLFRFD